MSTFQANKSEVLNCIKNVIENQSEFMSLSDKSMAILQMQKMNMLNYMEQLDNQNEVQSHYTEELNDDVRELSVSKYEEYKQ